MTLSTFFQKFDQFADAPDAVAKMRELVLELAVQGRLVSQDARDESAQALLKRISSAAKTRRRGDSEFDEPDAPFPIPENWVWVRLPRVLNKLTDGTHHSPANGSSGAFMYVTAKNIKTNGVMLDGITYVSKEVHDEIYSRCNPSFGDVLYIKDGATTGIATINQVKEPFSMLSSVALLKPSEAIFNRYLLWAMRSPFFYAETRGAMKGAAITRVTLSVMAASLLPLPPLAEQKRIVAKVDELMALCDRLEAQQQERETRHAALARASLARFAEAPTPENLNLIFHPSFSAPPADLRKAILTLAVQGKLVPQDPNDEPAEVPAPSRVTKSKGEREVPFELPGNWKWMQLGQVSALLNGDRGKNYPNKAEYVPEGVAWINTGHIEADGTLSLGSMHYITRKKFDSLRGGKVRPGDLVYCLRGATLGKTAIITQFTEGAVASSLVIIRLSTVVDQMFAYRFLTSPLGREQIFQFDNGSAQPNLSANNVKKYWIPIPPLPEQRRIVAKVSQLMALVDALETQLAAGRATAANLLSALVAELTASAQAPTPAQSPQLAQPSPQPAPARKRLNQHFARAVLSAEIVHRLHDEPTFGRVKHQKIFHLCEHIAQIEEISGQYHREAAGPLDNRLIYANEGELKKQQWYAEVPRKPYGHAYAPLPKAGSHHKYLEGFGSDKVGVIERLIELMRKWDTDRCEIFCTAYAAWNDLLIWKKEPTEEAILHQILDCWNPAKERFPRDRWLAAIKWMREHDFAPTGFGKPTAQP